MDSNVALVILGVALILLSLAGRIIGDRLAIDLQKIPARIVVGLMGGAILAVGMVGLWPPRLVSTPPEITSPFPTVTIQRPTDGAVVSRSIVATGTVEGANATTHIWLVVNPIGDIGWWPQGGALAVLPNGRWEQPAFLGGRPGQRFRLSVVVASKAAHQMFLAYLKKGMAKNAFPGKPLPAGTTVLVSHEVTLDPASL
ncbi:MAG TPA: hypothetical protein ENJ35_05745 [Gammaproteobacteria bacterium]|nr:hypothetical protein [Gammaproteobacteria bacterium]